MAEFTGEKNNVVTFAISEDDLKIIIGLAQSIAEPVAVYSEDEVKLLKDIIKRQRTTGETIQQIVNKYLQFEAFQGGE